MNGLRELVEGMRLPRFLDHESRSEFLHPSSASGFQLYLGPASVNGRAKFNHGTVLLFYQMFRWMVAISKILQVPGHESIIYNQLFKRFSSMTLEKNFQTYTHSLKTFFNLLT